MSRRDDLLARWATPGRRRVPRRLVAIGLGWLVLMTVWGFGRAWHGGLAPVELTLGLLGGTTATVVAWPRHRGDDPRGEH